MEQGRMIVRDRSEWRAVVNVSLMTRSSPPFQEVRVHLVWPLDHIRCIIIIISITIIIVK